MNIKGKNYRTIWLKNEKTVRIIDQRFLPFKLIFEDILSLDEMVIAIKEMHLRGAGLIGVAAAYGIYLAALHSPKNELFDTFILNSAEKLKATRPTAVNLSKAVEKQVLAIRSASSIEDKISAALHNANAMAEEDIEYCQKIGIHGLGLIESLSRKNDGRTINILTHCNAGWLAFVDYGTATSPIYAAFDKGISLHVWVDETRPRNQGAKLTAWELGNHGIPHTIIADNTGGHLMQHGMVDMVIVGSDRTTCSGDVANKIGTYLKALAAKDNNVPFYVALPSSTIDWKMKDGISEIPIEQRGEGEVKYMEGWIDGTLKNIQLTPEDSPVANYGFDVTPARLVTALITERGICEANHPSLLKLFPESKH